MPGPRRPRDRRREGAKNIGLNGSREGGRDALVKAAQVVLEAAEDEALARRGAGEAELDLLADEEVLVVEHGAVHEREGALPMRRLLGVARCPRRQHGVNE